MTAWTSDELTKIGMVEELEIAPLRRDGTPTACPKPALASIIVLPSAPLHSGGRLRYWPRVP
jgi:hypothetical protein